MKKIILSVLCICAAYNLQAQTETGNIFVGGGVDYSIDRSETLNGNATTNFFKSTRFGLRPQVGYFIKDQLAIGVFVLFQTNKREDINGDLQKSNTYIFSPFVRYYFPITDKFNLYGQGSAGIGGRNPKSVIGNTTTDQGDVLIFDAGLSAGLAFFPSEKFNINLSFQIISADIESNKSPGANIETKSSFFRIGANSFAPSLSLNYFFKK